MQIKKQQVLQCTVMQESTQIGLTITDSLPSGTNFYVRVLPTSS